MKREEWKKVYEDYQVLCAMVGGKDFEQGFELLTSGKYKNDVMNKDDELYDINFGDHACFTILNEDGKGIVDENSIEIWDGLDCLGIYTIRNIKGYGLVK